MNCPECGGKVRVMDVVNDCERVIRRRKCKECDHLFFTIEKRDSKARYEFTKLNRVKCKRKKG